MSVDQGFYSSVGLEELLGLFDYLTDVETFDALLGGYVAAAAHFSGLAPLAQH